MSPQDALAIAAEFWSEVWARPQNFEAIDELVADDFTLISGGEETPRRDFKAWATGFASRISDLHLEVIESFANPEGTRVATRWVITGRNNGVLGTPANLEPVAMTGTAILAIGEDRRIHANWVERSAWELYKVLRPAAAQ